MNWPSPSLIPGVQANPRLSCPLDKTHRCRQTKIPPPHIIVRHQHHLLLKAPPLPIVEIVKLNDRIKLIKLIELIELIKMIKLIETSKLIDIIKL